MVPGLVASDDLGEVFWAGQGRAFTVVASVAGGHEVVEAVVAAVAPWDEVVDLSAAADGGVALEAAAALEVE
jgi:hypothetical protein